MRVGIIGLGKAGIIHLDAWRATSGVQVVAGCDLSPAARRKVGVNGIKVHSSPWLMLRDEKLNAVSICTPPRDHAEITIACLKRGIHVLCEKPLALTTAAALKMIQAASRGRCHLLLATKFRHVADLIRARELISRGAIGTVVSFEIGFASRVDMSERWNAKPALAGGGVIIDNGCHAFDIVSFLFGSVVQVHGTLLKPIQKLPVEDSATILVRASNGVVGRIDLSWSLSTRRSTYATIYGSRGTIDIGWSSSKLTTEEGKVREIGRGYDKAQAHRQMLSRFLKVINGQAAAWISPVEMLRTVSAVEATYRSVRCGGWMAVNARQVLDQHAVTRQQA